MNGMSYAKGPVDTPLLETTIGEALRDDANRWGTGIALVSRHKGLR